jgi:hypothetical protein
VSAEVHEVAQWDVFELALNGPAEGNPFLDVDLRATFSLGERTVAVDGFYDGEGSYRVRFMPEQQGTWQFRTTSSSPALDGHEGQVACVEPGENNHGPVRVRDAFHFGYADGLPFRPLGTTCYAWTHQPEEQQRLTLDTLATGPFNKIRMCVFPKHYTYNADEPAEYVFPLLARGDSDGSGWSFDLERFQPAFFRQLEQRLLDLAKLGVEADLILFHPYDRWGFAKLTPEEDGRYLRYLIARLAPYRNVWWSLANEYDLMAKTPERWDALVTLVRELDPYDHLRSIHNCFQFFDHHHAALTHVSVQHDDVELTAVWRDRYRKPVLIDECSYEGNLPEAWGALPAQHMVDRFWTTTVYGGYATHGETFLGDVIWWSHGGLLKGDSPARIAFLRQLLDEAPPSLEPIVTTLNYRMAARGPREDASFRDMFGADGIPITGVYSGLHRVHEYYLFYLSERQPAALPADVPAGEMYEAAIIDTWGMTVTPLPDPVTRGSVIPLPARPYLAVRFRRLDS